MENKRIHSALISVYHKEGLDEIIRKMNHLGIVIYSTGGTKEYIEQLGVPVVSVETITEYPSILGGRVKTLHPKVFGGILAIRNDDHLGQLAHFRIPLIDLVIVDLYPFEKTVEQTDHHPEIIEKIDVGGIALIRAAAKNYHDVVVIPSSDDYGTLLSIMENQAISKLEQRRNLATRAFAVSSQYDLCIHNYLSGQNKKLSQALRYGENPHQAARFYGHLEEVLEILSGKELSYNNFLDVDSALMLMQDFYQGLPCFAVLKHTNVCGLAVRDQLTDAWKAALAGDPVSAFGGVLICNRCVDKVTAESIHSLFFEILIAPDFEPEAFTLLSSRKNRILIRLKNLPKLTLSLRTAINGTLEQDINLHHTTASDLKCVTHKPLEPEWISNILFAIHTVKHLKSNAIVLIKNQQLIGMGCGQTSRVDACQQALNKARTMGFDPKGSVMASEAFFPFPDCVELAGEAGVIAIAQPGGSVNDDKSIEKANAYQLAMVFTGIRHFKH